MDTNTKERELLNSFYDAFRKTDEYKRLSSTEQIEFNYKYMDFKRLLDGKAPAPYYLDEWCEGMHPVPAKELKSI